MVDPNGNWDSQCIAPNELDAKVYGISYVYETAWREKDPSKIEAKWKEMESVGYSIQKVAIRLIGYDRKL